MSNKKERDSLWVLGTILLFLGVAAWGVYAVLRFGLSWNVTGRQFLYYHLAGVIPGVILRRHQFFMDIIRRLSP